MVALRFGCCETYWPCDACHDAAADHEAVPWPSDRFDEPAVLCGACGTTITARSYLDGDSEARRTAGSRATPDDDNCPACGAAFTPGSRTHHDRYFELAGSDDGDDRGD